MRALLPRTAATLGVSLALALVPTTPASTADVGSAIVPSSVVRAVDVVPVPPDAPKVSPADYCYAAGAITGDFVDSRGGTATFTLEKPGQVHGYTVSITGDDSLRYGGPGPC